MELSGDFTMLQYQLRMHKSFVLKGPKAASLVNASHCEKYDRLRSHSRPTAHDRHLWHDQMLSVQCTPGLIGNAHASKLMQVVKKQEGEQELTGSASCRQESKAC